MIRYQFNKTRMKTFKKIILTNYYIMLDRLENDDVKLSFF